MCSICVLSNIQTHFKSYWKSWVAFGSLMLVFGGLMVVFGSLMVVYGSLMALYGSLWYSRWLPLFFVTLVYGEPCTLRVREVIPAVFYLYY